MLLLALGYLLRFPSSSAIGIFSAPDEYWRAFWTVDVLQLIGVGMLLLLFGAFLSERFRVNDYAVFGCCGLLFFICAPFCEQANWNEWLPAGVAAYLYTGSGSHFPLFPWAGYVMSGGVLGAYLAYTIRSGHGPGEPFRLSLRLSVAGTMLLALYYCSGQLKASGVGSLVFWDSNPDLTLLRLGAVLLLAALIALLSAGVHSVSPTLLLIGRRTLLIYVTHLVILYGSPWNSGLDRLCDKCLPVWPALFAVVLMQAAVIGLAVVYSKIELDKHWANLHDRWFGKTYRKLPRKRSAQRIRYFANGKKTG